MFNISFGEIFIIAVVGLIIIGPQRLPETARFVGHMLGRVQRQVAGVKSDIRREMDLEDLKNIKREYEDASRQVKDSFNEQSEQLRHEITAENTMHEPLGPALPDPQEPAAPPPPPARQ